MKKTALQLKPNDFSKYPVWEWDLDSDDETLKPVVKYPVADLGNRILGLKCILANGDEKHCTLSNVELSDPVKNEHFLFISIFINGKYVSKPRYFDISYNREMSSLVSVMKLSMDEIFPIRWDVSAFVSNKSKVKNGVIRDKPDILLTNAQIIDLAVD
jgi:hypothetical protein